MNKTTCTNEYIQNWLKENLSEERYVHSLGCAECAAELAEQFGEDKERAYFAGLIHDCAKCLPKEKSLEIIQNHVSLSEDELCASKTHHAPIGAYIAKTVFGVEDEEILSAIRWHTIGKVNMTTFEKIIFLADKLETRTRPCEICEPIRDALKEGLDKALMVCYKNTIKSLIDRNLRICTITIDIYNSLL